MKSLYITAITFLFITLTASAQLKNDDIIVVLNPNNANIDTNALSYISSVSLQANIPDTSVIGYTSDTASSNTYTLVPQTQLTNWLLAYVNDTYNSSFSNNGKRIYWLIKNFNLSESISNNSVYVHLEASIYLGSFGNSNAYWQLDTLLTFPHSQGSDYSMPFQNSVQTLVAYSANKAMLNNTSPSNQNANNKFKKSNPQTLRDFSDLPIIHDSIVNEGAFITLGQFANNTPSVTQIVMQADSVSTNGAVHVYHMNDDSSFTEITSLVALCINGELYAYRNNHIIAIERTSNSMLISRYRDPDARVNQAMYMRMILRYSPGNENPFDKEYRCTKPGYQDVVATCIDLDTGDLSF